MSITFKKSRFAGYFVYNDDNLIGYVQKIEHWTVRGNHVAWSASRKGRVVGHAETRIAAANLLSVSS